MTLVFDDLSHDILSKIYDFVCLDNTPLYNYRMRFINRDFKSIVDNHRGKICKHLDDTSIDKLVLYNRGHINIYKWLYEHRIFMKFIDVSHLINHGRIDVLQLSKKYKSNTDILFNRFYLSDGNANEQFSIFDLGIVSRSFLLLACELNNIDIVKFFLESPRSNIYVIQIGAAIDVCCEYHHLKVIEYLYKNHIDKFKHTMEPKLIKCIEIFGEGMYDLLIHLIKNEKITLTDKLKNTDIIKNLECI